ncbi:phosphonatase-like hydrolase [Mycobacteroides immunogenum]|uniref:Haloacid dehalogenase n=1 Tax=Mycobacteroides immunogenum TaxID=83262 RepID=A0A7V8LS78_9MYCO|nr:phosphonatase-like hydrolase [Mycobacteroides immunogenum]AMT70290.1 haloacid dehalogenase [Mycobacteroides immunogenum]ANO03356.1 haloacid dehalogenase [Mycobacteroides immunogenum]KIU42176.1 haloacid dehalogenase [Mycobacteroides immunogenum]KPG13376.1 haloacid dehalogenase [Mycobacteroides immunogenum]KPG14706.1 haloacid dehalogenase [Mycobacteroides immunogenum]
MSDIPIRLAVLDMAGTTVADGGLVLRAFETAATAGGIEESGPERDRARQYVIDTMGQSKIVVFRHLLGDEDRAQYANRAFEDAYDALIADGHAKPIEGAQEAIAKLRAAGVKVALTTGFSASTKEKLLAALGWTDIADLTLAPSEAGRGRPFPDLVLASVLRLRVDDVREVAVLGDTASDVLAGHRAGAQIVAGTLTGAHDAAQLGAAQPTHIVHSVGEFADLVLPRV